MERMRHTLAPFGVFATRNRMDGRAVLFAGMGGENFWEPDNTTIDHFPDRSFNYAWLMQGVGGGRVAIDKDRHIWLGTAGQLPPELRCAQKQMGLAWG